MTTEDSRDLLKDLRSIPSPLFFIFAAVALFCGFYFCGFTVAGIFTTLFLLLLVACAASDLNAGVVPDLILIAIALLGLVSFFVVSGWSVGGLIDRLIGAVCVSVPMLVLALVIKGAFGGGDIKLIAAAGFYLGWKYTLGAAVIGLFLAGVYAIYLLLTRKKDKHARMRIAPFLAYGAAVAALFGDQMIMWGKFLIGMK